MRIFFGLKDDRRRILYVFKPNAHVYHLNVLTFLTVTGSADEQGISQLHLPASQVTGSSSFAHWMLSSQLESS
jgi:hypothetical protein